MCTNSLQSHGRCGDRETDLGLPEVVHADGAQQQEEDDEQVHLLHSPARHVKGTGNAGYRRSHSSPTLEPLTPADKKSAWDQTASGIRVAYTWTEEV